MRRVGVLLALLLLAGCVAGHDVVIVVDLSGAGSLVVTRSPAVGDGGDGGPERGGEGVTAHPNTR